MSERITTRWDKVEALRTARRRRALAELDYRRAVIDVVESGLEVSESVFRGWSRMQEGQTRGDTG